MAKIYTTWNPSDKGSEITLSGGNLVATKSGSTSAFMNGGIRSTLGVSSGKHYFEYVYTEDNGSNWPLVGVGNSSGSLSDHVGSDGNSWGIYAPDGDKYHDDTGSDYGSSFAQGDVIGIALDMGAGKVWFSKNGTWMNSGNPAAGTGEAFSGLSGTIYAMIVIFQPGSAWTAKFGASALSYSAPSGFNSGLYEERSFMQSVAGKSNCVKLVGKTKAQYVKIMGIDTGLQVIGQNISMDLGAGPTAALYGDDLVVSDHNHIGTVVNTISIDGGSSYGASKALGCPAEVKAVKLKSVDDVTTRIQDLSVILTDNSAVCE